MIRCPWCKDDELYMQYHDQEWGVPVHGDKKHFEFLVLESAQAGLSWITILRKRENYRKAYANFDPYKVALYDEQKIEELLNNPGIVRNGKKIEASINNANRFIDIVNSWGSFDKYIWSFVNKKPIKNEWKDSSQVPANSQLSTKISKDLKEKGFKFLGPTIIYSYMQAVGLVNDHLIDCFRYDQV